MTNFHLQMTGKVVLAIVVTTGFVAIARAAAPLRAINDIIAEMKEGWTDNKLYQSINDKYYAGKMTRLQWLEAMNNGPAKDLWLVLSTSYPNHTHYIAKRIRQEYPHATKWV